MNWPSIWFPVYFDTAGTYRRAFPERTLALNSTLILSATEISCVGSLKPKPFTAYPAILSNSLFESKVFLIKLMVILFTPPISSSNEDSWAVVSGVYTGMIYFSFVSNR